MTSLFQLPRELREIIYGYYLRCDGGYVYNPETQKLKQANGSHICYALASTCRQAASELNGLAFELNAIAFSTTYLATTQKTAGLHHNVVGLLKSCKQVLLKHTAPELFTMEMAQLLIQEYPQFAGLVETWWAQNDMSTFWDFAHPDYSFGEAMSLWNDFFHRVLYFVSRNPAYVDTVKSLEEARFGGVSNNRDPLQLKDLHLEPWCIVDRCELLRITDVIGSRVGEGHYSETHYTYSAAALALRFLASCTDTIRASVRRIILLENQESVSQPEGHGRGFIPLCQANAALRVERHVNLWKAIFPVCDDMKVRYVWRPKDSPPHDLKHDRLYSSDITQSVGKWIMEAMALPSLGMPAGSYTLILDGEPTLEHTSRVFRIVQRDATYQAALDACYASGTLQMPSWLERRSHPGHKYEGFPTVIHKLSTTGDSIIRCNFDLGAPCNIEDMLERRSGWDWWDWKNRWAKHEPSKFQTESPLPPWHILRWQHVIP